MAPDQRRVVGAKVTARATHVTSPAECGRQYGGGAKSKWLIGTVLEVLVIRQPGGKRASTKIKAEYELGGGHKKVKIIPLQSVKIWTPPPPEEEEEQQQQQQPPINSTTHQEDNSNAEDGDEQQPPPLDAAELVPLPGDQQPPPPAQQQQEQHQQQEQRRQPVVEQHGVKWYEDDPACRREIHSEGAAPVRQWAIRPPIGNPIHERSVPMTTELSRLDFFVMMMPPQQINLMLRETNRQLEKHSFATTTRGELFKFFGLLILATKFEFGNRSSLWRTTADFKYIPAPCFGRTGMSRERFDRLWKCLRFSFQPDMRPETMSSETYRWMLIDDFIENFNNHRACNFVPSSTICVDESIVRWYGLGGDWINMGLPMYVAIDRKPENGAEIQDACCGESGIMCYLKLVKTAVEEAAGAREQDDHSNEELPHGAKVMVDLVRPWICSQ